MTPGSSVESFEVGRVYRCESTVPIEEADRLSSSGPCAFWDKSLEVGAIFSVDELCGDGGAHIEVLEGHPPDTPDRVNMEDYFVSSGALARCVAVPASECIRLLDRLIRESKRSSVLVDAVLALGHIGGPESFPALVEASQNRDGRVRLHAVVVMAAVGDRSLIPKLQTLLTDEARGWMAARSAEFCSVAQCAREAIDSITARDG